MKTKLNKIFIYGSFLFLFVALGYFLYRHDKDLGSFIGMQSGITPTYTDLAYGYDPAEVMDVFIPANPNGTIIVEIHGGGWNKGYKDQFDLYYPDSTGSGYIEKLYAAGYIICSIDYPLVIECGQPGWPGCIWQNDPNQLTSVEKAFKFVRLNGTNWGWNGRKVGAIGGSAGGHLVMCALTHNYTGVNRGATNPNFVIACWTPTAVSKQWFLSTPSRPAQWELFGTCNLTDFNNIPDAETQSASPFYLAKQTPVPGIQPDLVDVPILGVYEGDITKTSWDQFNWPSMNGHGQEFGWLLKSSIPWNDYTMHVVTSLQSNPLADGNYIVNWALSKSN